MPSSGPERLVVVLGYSRGRKGELHPICAARLEHAAALAGENDVVLLSGWSRHSTALPEAELMRRAWPGATDALVCDPDARITAENAANAAAHARDLGVSDVVVVTSRWHRLRAGILFRSLLPDVRVSVEGARHAGASAGAAARARRLPARALPARPSAAPGGRAQRNRFLRRVRKPPRGSRRSTTGSS